MVHVILYAFTMTLATKRKVGGARNHVRRLGSSRNKDGLAITPTHTLIGPRKLEKALQENVERRREREQGKSLSPKYPYLQFISTLEMSLEEKQNLQALRENIPMECDDDDHFQSEDITLQDVLDGTIPLGMSHAGGEYEELRKALQSELSKKCVLRTSL